MYRSRAQQLPFAVISTDARGSSCRRFRSSSISFLGLCCLTWAGFTAVPAWCKKSFSNTLVLAKSGCLRSSPGNTRRCGFLAHFFSITEGRCVRESSVILLGLPLVSVGKPAGFTGFSVCVNECEALGDGKALEVNGSLYCTSLSGSAVKPLKWN